MDSPTTYAVSPKAPGERIAWLDALRGLSIWGIALINVQFFAMSFFRLTGWRWSETPASENLARSLLVIFAEKQFFQIFAMLFGLGIWFQYTRSMAAGKKGGWLHVRRMAVLLAFGLAHGVLLWYGDILAMYAVVGLIAWLWIRRSGKGLILWAVVLLAVPPAINVLDVLWGTSAPASAEQSGELAEVRRALASDDSARREWARQQVIENIVGPIRKELEAERDAAASRPTTNAAGQPSDSDRFTRGMALLDWMAAKIHFVADDVSVYQEGRFRDMALHRTIWFLAFSPVVAIKEMGWTALGMMLLGIWLARSGMWDLMSRPRTAFLSRWFAWLVLIPGTAMQILGVALGAWWPDSAGMGMVHYVLAHVGSLLMTLGYVAGFVALYAKPGWSARLQPLVAVGRMSLTNYLATSLLLGLVFYGYGLGLIGQVGFVTAELIAVAVLALLTVFSMLWLRFFWFGPLEWLWRTLTYLRRPA